MSGTSAGTERFLNTLRVVGRMWGSHGDKIQNAAQGRSYDDEVRAAFKSPAGAGRAGATGAGIDEPGGSGGSSSSPIIARQLSREMSLGSPAIVRQASSIGAGAGAGSPSILRQSSSIGAGANGRDSPPPLIGRQASRDLIVSDLILRQQSRDRLGGGATSPVAAAFSPPSSPVNTGATSSVGGAASVNVTATGFRPIASSPASPTTTTQAPSPVASYLVPTLPPVAAPTALRPAAGGLLPLTRLPSSGLGSPLLRTPTSDFMPIAASLPAGVLGEAATSVSAEYHTNHRTEEAAAKAVQRVVEQERKEKEKEKEEKGRERERERKAPVVAAAAAVGKKEKRDGGGSSSSSKESKEVEEAKDATAVVVDQGKAAPLSAADKAAIVRQSQHHGAHHHRGGKGSRGSKNSLGASGGKAAATAAEAAAGTAATSVDEPSGESWRPGMYIGRLLGGGSSSSSKAIEPASSSGEPNAA